MRSGASGMLLAALENGRRGGDLLTSASRTRPRLHPELDRDQFFAIITQKGGRRASGQETDPSCSSTTDYVRRGATYLRGGIFRGKLVCWRKKEEEEEEERKSGATTFTSRPPGLVN